MIFTRPKPKAYPKPGVSRKKDAIQKTNPPKETTTSIDGPSNKGENLSTPDAKVQDKQPKDLPIEEKEMNEPKVLLYTTISGKFDFSILPNFD